MSKKREKVTKKEKRACLGKKQHKHKTGAEFVLEQMNDSNLNIYRCRYCGFYHIGHRFKK